MARPSRRCLEGSWGPPKRCANRGFKPIEVATLRGSSGSWGSTRRRAGRGSGDGSHLRVALSGLRRWRRS
eukprot:4875612-Alexandrium_andersonii.AAC.1